MNDYVIDNKLCIRKIFDYKDSGEISGKMQILVNQFVEYPIYTAKSADITRWLKELNIIIPSQ